jgi:hypothetical protein
MVRLFSLPMLICIPYKQYTLWALTVNHFLTWVTMLGACTEDAGVRAEMAANPTFATEAC